MTLSFLQKILRTDVNYLLKGGFWLSIGQGVSAFSALALAVAFANLIPPEAYGTYKFITSYAAILTAFSLTGVTVAIAREAARGADRSLIIGALSSLKWGALSSFAALGFTAYYALNDNLLLAGAFALIATFSAPIRALALYLPFLEGKKEFKRKVTYTSIASLAVNTLLIASLFTTDNPLIIVLVLFSGQLVVSGICFWLTIHKLQNDQQPDKDFLNYSKHLSVMSIFSKLSLQLDNILVFHQLDAAQLAIYSFAKAPTTEIGRINVITKLLAVPKLSIQSVTTLKRHLPRKAGIYFLVCILIAFAYWLIAPYLYQLVFPKYLDSIFLSQVGMLHVLFFPSMLFRQALIAHKAKRSLYIINSCTPFIRVAGIVLLFPIFGLLGVVLGLLLSQAVNALLVGYYFYRL